nr:S24 family peptidase [uncultured Kingella sp.]
MYPKLSIAELLEWQQEHCLSLPATSRGIALKIQRENWEFEEVAGKGGKGGVKRIYTLPEYLIDEIKEKGLSHLLSSEKPKDTAPSKPRRVIAAAPAVGIPFFMQSMVAQYADWAQEQDTEAIVPVRYHVNVFGSAGGGYAVDEPVETEAMWFRAAFFNYLGVPPAQCFCTRVRGDSMHPTLIDRGTVLWKMQNGYTREGIYLFRQVDELRIKRLQRTSRSVYRIISDNSNKDIYPVETLDLTDLGEHDFEIYGFYLWDCSIKE